jgi:Flp pilus assembly protein CpaB
MKSRGLVVVLALILATLAVVGLFLYTNAVRQDAEEGGTQTTVVVSKVDIPANTDLNSLINQGQFVLVQVPTDRLVSGAIKDIEQLRNRRNNAFILRGEQIPLGRVQGGQVTGGVLGIPEGYQAMTVELDAPAAVSGALAGGDNVTIYATFQDVELTVLAGKGGFEKALQQAVKQQQQQQTTTQGQAAELPKFDTTVVLVPQVEVLRVFIPRTGGTTAGQTAQPTGRILVTLAFLPQDAQNFVLSLELGDVYLSLLPPDEQGEKLDPITIGQVLLPEKAK